jgi:hypothetical protein
MLVNHMQKDALRSSVDQSIKHFTSYLAAYDDILSFAPRGLGYEYFPSFLPLVLMYFSKRNGSIAENEEASLVDVPSWVLGGEKLQPISSPPHSLLSFLFRNNFVFDVVEIFYINLVVSVSGDGSLEFSPPLAEFESRIPELVTHIAAASLTLPALDVATIDLKFHEDPLTPIFPDELTLSGYFS